MYEFDIDRLVMPPRRGRKVKSISAVIRNKVNDWLKSLPPDLRDKVKDHVIVTGGCIATMLLGDGEPSDFDIYLDNKESALLLAQHYVAEFNNDTQLKERIGTDVSITVRESTGPNGEERIGIWIQSAGVAAVEVEEQYGYFEGDATDEQAEEFVQQAAETATAAQKTDGDKKYRPVHLSQNAITLWGKIQLVIRFFGDAATIHQNFDFVHCTNYWTPKDGVVLNIEALEALMTRTLIYSGSRYPICSMIRTRKFIMRGFTCTAGQYLKMAMQVSDLDLHNIDTLKEQLVGVDAAYFAQLLHTIETDMKTTKDAGREFTIDTSYIAKLIDSLV